MPSLLRPFTVLSLLALAAVAVHAETAYFVLTGNNASAGPGISVAQAYVVSTSDPALIAQARAYLANPPPPSDTLLGASAKVALGADGVNLNYSAPGHPAWPWHVTQLLSWINLAGIRTMIVGPGLSDGPSNVPAILAGEDGNTPRDTVSWYNFYLSMEITPGKSAALANVSSRGAVGTGDNVLIVGFIVQGAEPRNVVIRALGPTLTSMGVSGVLADPKIALYRGSTKIAENDNWADGSFTPALLPDQPWLAWLFPTNPKEAALYLTLTPGAYTVIVTGVNNGTGISLADVHDVDALKSP